MGEPERGTRGGSRRGPRAGGAAGSRLAPGFLSDRGRPLLVPLLLLLLVALGARFGQRAVSVPVGYERALLDPVAWDGRTVRLALWRVERVEPGRYWLRLGGREVPVLGDPGGLRPGQAVSVLGRFDAERRAVVELRRDEHRGRRLKKLWSLLALGFLALYAPLALRWRDGALEVRPGWERGWGPLPRWRERA